MTIRYQLTAVVQRIWDIEGYPNHFFGDDNELYRITKRGELRRIRRSMKRYTQGYVIKSQFYSLSQLRPMLRRHDLTGYPAGF
ncbi:hypothetical protein HNV11_04765 [Spirosoma taeanense]|uniref:NUMOD4 domain-containing protein n=1 Tax=Spirosoma taeanense TaxID=2735870 RepID=A0A6M5Y4K6_9BACT|nr:hypothetical protein [Spirosoma taeanense]QJW88739.1 hypothetical protein HNV11_04765 [Spirosoma taeanense]